MKTTVLMNSYRENKKLFRRAVESALEAGCDQLILSTVKDDPCIGWGKRYPIVIVVNKKPGIFQQINAMLPHIEGDYVCYASSNDEMMPHKLYQEAELLAETGKKVCYSAFKVISKVNGKKYVARFPDYTYEKNLEASFVSDCAMVEAKTFLRYTPFVTRYGNSAYRDLWLRIYEGEGNVFIYNDTPTWVYYVTQDSQHIKAQKDNEVYQRRMFDRRMMLKDHLKRAGQILGRDHPSVKALSDLPGHGG